MRIVAFIGLLLLLPIEAVAQFATLRGSVLEASTEQPLVGATVSMRSQDHGQVGTVTDAEGRYELRRLRPGTWVLSVRFLGFGAHSDTLEVGFNQVIEYDVRMSEDEAVLDEVVVDAERTSGTAPTAGLFTVDPSSLARVPMPGVAYDLAGYLLTLPGFVATGDRGGQLYVRGGTPTQNLVLLDGIPIFQPFHIVGFYSAFPADIISYADVYAGGFGARYGGRISSVIDIQTRNGNKKRVTGSASIAPFLSSVQLDVPIVKDQVSLVASVRESLIERISPDLLGQSLPYRFGDRFLKFHAFVSPTSSFSITGLHTYDRGDVGVGEDGIPRQPSTWRNMAIGSRLTYLPPEYPALARFAVYLTQMDSRFEPAEQAVQTGQVQSMTLQTDIQYLLGETQIHIGVFGNLYRIEYRRGDSPFENRQGVTSGGGYLDTSFQLFRRIRIEPGVRLERFSQGIRSRPGPRLRLAVLPFGPTSRQQISFAWGRYYQQIVGLNNERDVADVFTVWTSSPAGTSVPEAEHFMAGIKQAVGRGMEVSVEAYHKELDNISFPVFNESPDGFAGFGRARGTVRGIDTRFEISRRAWYLQGSYSLSEVEYQWKDERRGFLRNAPPHVAEVGKRFNPPHDRRHQIGLLGQLDIRRFTLNVRWQYGGGLPFTQINGFYRAFPLNPDDPNALAEDPGDARISRSDVFGGRLPDYHRLDVTLDRVFEWPHLRATLQMGAINAYDRSNIFAFNFLSGERVDQLPLLPTLGLEVAFR